MHMHMLTSMHRVFVQYGMSNYTDIYVSRALVTHLIMGFGFFVNVFQCHRCESDDVRTRAAERARVKRA